MRKLIILSFIFLLTACKENPSFLKNESLYEGAILNYTAHLNDVKVYISNLKYEKDTNTFYLFTYIESRKFFLDETIYNSTLILKNEDKSIEYNFSISTAKNINNYDLAKDSIVNFAFDEGSLIIPYTTDEIYKLDENSKFQISFNKIFNLKNTNFISSDIEFI